MNEMKQTYTKPEMEVIEIETETMMLGLSAEGSLGGTGTGGSGSGLDADVNKRRGQWGNLWEDSRWWSAADKHSPKNWIDGQSLASWPVRGIAFFQWLQNRKM